jgi:hypothetical protein
VPIRVTAIPMMINQRPILSKEGNTLLLPMVFIFVLG